MTSSVMTSPSGAWRAWSYATTACESGNHSSTVSADQCTRGVADALKGAVRRLGKFHRESTGAKIAPKLLAKQHLDIRFVVNDENEEAHMFAPALLAVAARGRITLNSVNSPCRVSTSIDPACCLTIMS